MLDREAAIAARQLDQRGLITARQLGELGVDRRAVHRRIESGSLVRVQPRVYRAASIDLDWRGHVLAAVLAVVGAVASHRAATALWWLEGALGKTIDITVSRPTRQRLVGVRIHRPLLLPVDITETDGIPVTNVRRTLLDVAGLVSPDAAVRMFDDAVRRRLTTYEAIADRLVTTAKQGRPGIRVARAILDERLGEEVSLNRFERLVRDTLCEAGIAPPVAQHKVQLPGGTFYLDLAWPDRMVAVECDGWESHSSPSALMYDLDRQNQLVLAGWTILRFSWRKVVDEPDQVVGHVAAALG